MRLSLLTAALGLWLIAVTLTFGAKSHPMFLSDVGAGVLLILFGLLSLSEKRAWARWAVGIVGAWLQFSPLAFFAPESMTYLNDTMTGVLAIIICFAMSRKEEAVGGIQRPIGWSYNPSAWTHRVPTVFLAMLCWFFARYMAAFQLGYIDHIWDPLFKDGTLHVITSKISKDFPVSDAGLGAFCYTMEAIFGWQGDSRRWATMPWLVLAFGFMVVPVGIVSITLIILQPVVVGAWCSWCLATAASMLVMILLTAGELVATLQFLCEAKKSGYGVWQVLWKGLQPEKLAGAKAQPSKAKGGLGIGRPWNLVASIAIGIWLMASPSILGISGPVATSNYILGPLIAAFSVIALAEVFRAARYFNILFGAGLIAAALFVSLAGVGALANNFATGILVIALAWRKGEVGQTYGMSQRIIF
ncbi:MAG: vitamin K epoxide reductase family protein [Chlamydiota bacterium]